MKRTGGFAKLSRIVPVAVLLFGSSNASADPDNLALIVTGTASAHAREIAASSFEAAARGRGPVLTVPEFSAKDTATIKSCVTAAHPWRCIAPVIHDKELHRVAVISLTNDTGPDSSPMLVITAQLVVADLDAAITDQRFCVRCTDDVLTTATAELTRALFQTIDMRSGRTVVAIKSIPRGARILFDGSSMGATDRSFNTFPGKHTIVLELDGYRREIRTIEAALDRTAELSITMRSVLESANEHRTTEPQVAEQYEPSSRGSPTGSPTSSSLAPKLAIVTGSMALVAGVIVLVFNEHPSTSQPGHEQPPVYYDTRPPGIGLILGGAVVGLGGYLWWRYTRSTVAPTAESIPGGATVGISKAF